MKFQKNEGIRSLELPADVRFKLCNTDLKLRISQSLTYEPAAANGEFLHSSSKQGEAHQRPQLDL